jgi:lysophospholipase L1-like esterase
VLSRKDSEKPDAIFIQECSVYFPGDLDAYKKKYKGWIDAVKEKGIKPVIVTTVPPASSQGFTEDVKMFIKKYILGRDSQHKQIEEFNNWLKEFASKENIPVLDLEKQIRISENERVMNDKYDSGDGIHVNAVAYKKLDNYLYTFLQKMYQ